MSNDASKRSVCIRASYWINGEAQEARCFDESNVEPSRMGLPVGTDPVKVSRSLSLFVCSSFLIGSRAHDS